MNLKSRLKHYEGGIWFPNLYLRALKIDGIKVFRRPCGFVQKLADWNSFVRSGDIPRDLLSFSAKACHVETFMKILHQSATDGEVRLKEYECVEVKNHNDVGITIEEWQKKGWRLHTYQTAGMGAGPMAYKVNHYLLFERETGS